MIIKLIKKGFNRKAFIRKFVRKGFLKNENSLLFSVLIKLQINPY
jgi:hypothetical protein